MMSSSTTNRIPVPNYYITTLRFKFNVKSSRLVSSLSLEYPANRDEQSCQKSSILATKLRRKKKDEINELRPDGAIYYCLTILTVLP